MEAERSKSRVLHVLRSVMLAGAGAVVWIALSSIAANADSGSTNNHTLPRGPGSAATTVVHNAAAKLSGTLGNAVSAGLASLPAPAVDSARASAVHLPAGQVPPVVVKELPQLARSVGQLVASTPVVSVVLPEGTVGAVTARVVSPAASAVDWVGSSVGTLVGRLPVAIPEITVPSIQIPDVVGVGDALAAGPAVVEPFAGASSSLPQDVADPLLSLAGPSGPPGLNGTPSKATVRASGSNDPSVPPSDGTFPPVTPGGSDAGSGSAAAPSGPSGAAAAWLQGANLFYPLAGTLASTAAAGRVPAPVSFDPGSSPD